MLRGEMEGRREATSKGSLMRSGKVWEKMQLEKGDVEEDKE